LLVETRFDDRTTRAAGATFPNRPDEAVAKANNAVTSELLAPPPGTTGPRFQDTDLPTEFHYFNWTDMKGASGFPPNTPMATGSNSDSILVLTSQQGAGQWATLTVPYPLGFYSRGLDARNDDARSPSTGFQGWKSRAIWSNYGTHFVWHIEGGKGVKGKEVKFQVRPNPLAR
jgi:hypothetical protein